MKQKNFLKTLLCLLFISNISFSQDILTFEFSALAGSEVTATSNSNNANIGSSTISRGTGLNPTNNGGRFNANSWNTSSIDNAVINNDYMEFTISPNATYEFSVSSIEIKLQRSGTGPSGIAIRNSLDSYASNLDSEKTIIDNTSTQSFTFTFAQSSSTSAVTYRIYMHAEGSSGSGGIGDFTGNDIVVNGLVASTSLDPTISFDSATSSVTETNTSFDINIPVTMTNFDSDVQVSISVNGAGTAHLDDFGVNSPSLFFVANETQNISLTINPDADSDSETVILDISVSFGSADLGISQHTITITDDDLPNIIINEILADPNGIDANGDGTVSSDNDEFIELVNLDASSYDLTGYTISDASLRYTFGATTIPAGGSVVIFGGGTPTGIPGISDTTSSLGLANGGDTVTLRNSGGNTIATYTYGSEGGDDQSLGRDDDSSGGFVKHSTIGTNPVKASPGRTNVSGLPFITLTWTGTTNIWETDGNWSSGNKPTASDDVIIPSGLSFYPTIETGVNAVANTITIASGATLKTEGTATLAADVIYNRTLTNGSQWYLMSSPVIGETYNDSWVTDNSIPSSTLDVDNRGISWYDNSSSDTDSDGGLTNDSATGYWRYMEGGLSGSFAIGRGYGIIKSNSGTVSFVGTGIYTSNQNFTLAQGDNNFNLIGNPFTGFITLGTFHATNSGVIGTSFYTWNGSSYTTRLSNVANSDNQNYEIAPGQGFFVEATSASNVTFEVSDVSHQNTDTFEKASNEIGEIKLNLTEGKNNRFARIYYINGTTTGFDNGYDGKLFGGVSNPFAIYSHLVSDSKGDNYQIQSLPNSNYENMIVPLGINTSTGKEITFTADALNLPADIKVFLEDRLTNTFTRLDEANTNYTITLTENTNGIGRFYLHTKSSVLNVDDLNLENISIYKTSNSNLRIVGLTQGKSNVKLYNILGKQVLNSSFNSNDIQDIPLPKLASGVYIVQLETGTGILNKKITLE